MKVFWSKAAKQDRNDIASYIAKKNIEAACDMLDIFDSAARRLEEFPQLGVEGRISGTRELVVHKHYVLVYEISENDTLIILAVLHTSRQYPLLFQ